MTVQLDMSALTIATRQNTTVDNNCSNATAAVSLIIDLCEKVS